MITWNEMIQLQASQGSVESRPNTLNLKVKKGKKEVGVAYMPGRSEPLPLPPATPRASLLVYYLWRLFAERAQRAWCAGILRASTSRIWSRIRPRATLRC